MREFLAAATPAVVLAFAVVASFTTPTALAFVATPPPTAMMNGVSSQQQRLLPSPSIHKEGYQRLSTTELASTTNHDENIGRWWQKAITTAVLTASFWSAPALLGGSVSFMPALSSSPDNSNSNSILVQNTAASAKEMASGSGSRVNKDPESLLRYGLPIQNKEVRKLQTVLESVKVDLGSKRKSAALESAKKAKTILASKDADKMKASCRDAAMCETYLSTLSTQLDPLIAAVTESQTNFNGSEQERASLDRAYAAQVKAAQTLTVLEEQMIPPGYVTPVPEVYNDLAQLRGRATVEMKLRKADKSQSFVVQGDTSIKEAKLVMVIDGYVAPVTAGNFVDLVSRGFYNNMEIQRADGFVVQTGDPPGDAVGYVGKGGRAVGNGPKGERLLPLEIFVKGDTSPTYESTIEDEGRGGQATVLPFSSYGAMGWAREEYEANSGSSQFFWLLFDSDLTPAGKNVLDGRYPCFGYVVEGADFLSDIQEGDVIVAATVTKGSENLVQPQGN